ncbi:3-dehydroquinate synthase [Paenibacillus terrigena]|uniref:3-dehydroquinate synthase n=1 Tax=Paenibacillus terrigena TaxID=369333 RepID=UPI0028D067C6|nr:3-dehydroquinate synthase [Paenibacillus terrigena]
MRELTVDLGERSYPIYFGEGLLNQAAQFFTKRGITSKSPIMIVTDSSVAPHYLSVLEAALQSGGYRTVSYIVPSGEKSKSLSQLEEIVTVALEAGLDRSSTVVALGGGVVGDLAGFVAASYMRGIKFVQVPTTILAHDSSVGGKVGVNHALAKNIIGAFHQPEMVLYDLNTLRTLPAREVASGLAEMIKHGLIWDAEFVAWIDGHVQHLLALEPESLSYGLYKGCSVKASVVAEDERENDLRAILNLGHTIGHALEAVSGYNELLHGEAIAIGMVGSALIAKHLGFDASIHEETKRIFTKFGLPTSIPPHLNVEQIMDAMMHDKKFKEGSMVFVVPTAIGQVEIMKDISAELVRQVVIELKEEI